MCGGTGPPIGEFLRADASTAADARGAPRQAARACALFPDARLRWFDRCGHFPHWDQPDETVQLILETIGERPRVLACEPAGPGSAAAVPAAAPVRRRTAQREPLTQRG